VIDDGSTDDLMSEIGPFIDRIRLVRQSNAGLAAARNRGIAEARGPLIAPIDADDLWHPDYLSTLVAALDGTPAAPFAYAGSHRIDESDHLLPELRLARTPDHDFSGLLSLNSVGSGSAAVFRKTAIETAGGYDTTLRDRAAQGAEDWKLILQLAAVAPPVFVPRKLAAYRLTRTGMSQNRPDRQLAAIEAVIGDLRAAFPKVSAHRFRDARTMMIAWLLPAYLRKRMWMDAALQCMRAYALNPLWWRNRNLRLVHMARVKMAISLRQASTSHIIDLEDRGEYPFAFLAAEGAL
jgi:glycosyltransferase involved in cell wall biosynthesis